MTKRIISGLIAVAAVYMLGAFIAGDIDFRNWEVIGRAMAGFLMAAAFVLGAMMVEGFEL